MSGRLGPSERLPPLPQIYSSVRDVSRVSITDDAPFLTGIAITRNGRHCTVRPNPESHPNYPYIATPCANHCDMILSWLCDAEGFYYSKNESSWSEHPLDIVGSNAFQIKVGDQVEMGNGSTGIVINCLQEGEFPFLVKVTNGDLPRLIEQYSILGYHATDKERDIVKII